MRRLEAFILVCLLTLSACGGTPAKTQEKSLYDYGITVGPGDKILTLSTCTVKYGAQDNDHRFVVMARLLPEGAEAPKEARLTAGEPAE